MQPVDISRMRLVSQNLVGETLADPTAVARHLLALQGQDMPGVSISLAQRSTNSLADVRAAFDEGKIVRTWLQRGTLHVLPVEDLHWYLATVTRRRYTDGRGKRAPYQPNHTNSDRAGEIARDLLRSRTTYAPDGTVIPGRATRKELTALWEEAGVIEEGVSAYQYFFLLNVEGLMVQGPIGVNGDPDMVLIEDWVDARLGAPAQAPDRADAVRELVRRYVLSHGPATRKDLNWWTGGYPLGEIDRALAELDGELASVVVDGTTYWMSPDLPDRATDMRTTLARSLLLLPGFDELMLGYTDRTATVPEEHLRTIDPMRNGIFRRTVVSGGRLAGLWKVTGPKRKFTVEHLEEPTPAFERRVHAAARRLPK